MPFYLTFIRAYYIFLTVLVFLAPLNYPLWKFIPSIVMLWLTYYVFKRGCKKGWSLGFERVGIRCSVGLSNKLLFFFLGMLVFIPLWVRFYTGGNLALLVMGFYSNVGADSNYNEYYKYMLDNNLNQFSLSKLPYIFGYGIAKLLFYYFVFTYIGYSKKISKFDMLIIVLLFLLYSMVGMSRGTSFENFESLILLMFATLVRTKILNNTNFYSKRQLLRISIILGIAGAVFVAGMALRTGGDNVDLSGPTATLDYNESSLVMSIFPLLGKIALKLSGYFTFGLYFTSELFWKIWTNSIEGMMNMLVPFSAPLINGDISYREALEGMGVDTGACWDPDFTGFSYYLGVPILFYFIYLIGVLSGRSYNKCVFNKDVGHCLVLFMIVYEMISLHVGNFIIISSSNKILLLAIVLIMRFNMFKKYRFR